MKEKLEEALAKSWDLSNQKSYFKALTSFKKLIKQYPQELRVYIEGAKCALIANELNICRKISQQGVKQFPDSLELQSFIIAVTRLEGNIQDALLKLVELKMTLVQLPPVLETEKYRAYFQLAAYDKALESVNRVLAVAPKDIIALRDKIEILICLNKLESAEKLCEELIQDNIVNNDIIMFYVEALKKQYKIDKAKAILKQYKPFLWELNLARCEIINNNFDSALKIYEQTLQSRPHGPWLSYNKARILEYNNHPKHKIYQYLRHSFFNNHNKPSDHIYLRGIAKLGFGNDALNYFTNLGLIYKKHNNDSNYIFDSLRICNFSRGRSLIPSKLNQRLELFDSNISHAPEREAVIVSGWFRTGTTYTFSLFRDMNNHFTPYYEPLHPFVFGGIQSNSSSNEKLNHKLDLGYYYEYQFIDYKALRIRYLERFEAGSNLLYSLVDNLPMFDYVNFIIKQTNKETVPLLQFNRISFILEYFKVFYKNAHLISLIRSSRDVFSSIVNHYNRVYDVFPFNAPFPSCGSPPRPLGPHNDDWEVIDTFAALLEIFDISSQQVFSFYAKVYVINQTAELFAREFSDVVISYEELAQEGSQLLTNILLQRGLVTKETIENTNFVEPHQKSIDSWKNFIDQVDFDAEEAKCSKILEEITTKFKAYVKSLNHIIK